MQAVINVSGEGTRLRPLSCTKCSGMLKIGECNITERLIASLRQCGVYDIVIVVGYMADEVKEFFGDGKSFGVNIKYIMSHSGDSVLKNHSDILCDEFIYFSKPVYTEENFDNVLKFHRERDSYATILVERGVNDGIITDKAGHITRFEEKHLWDSMSENKSGLGIYVLNRDIVKFISDEAYIELVENVFPSLVRSGKGVYSYTCEKGGEIIRDQASFMRANFMYLDSLKEQYQKGIRVNEGATVEKGALLEGPCYIGKNTVVKKGAKIGAYSYIGDDCTVQEGTSIKRSYVNSCCRIEKNASLRGCILDDRVKVGKSVSIYEQSIVGTGTVIEDKSSVKPFVKIWPEKSIGKGTVVSENIMWGQKKRTKLFENDVIEGIVNVDITPRFCTALGECIGTLLSGGEVGVSTDGSPSGMMIKEGVVTGLMGTGTLVKDFGEQPLPITRKGVSFYMLKGAVCINVSENSGEERAEITIVGKDGLDIDDDTRDRLEELFEKGDLIYPEGKDIKESEYFFEYKLYYLKSLVGYKKKKGNIKKVLVSCSAAWGRRLISSALSDFSIAVSMYSPPVKVRETAEIRSFEAAVSTGDFDMGFIVDEKCEKVKIVLKGGSVDDETYEALCALIVMKKYPNAKVYVPITATSAIEQLADTYSGCVIRTKTAPREIMRHVAGEEGQNSDQFIFRFDAVGAIIKLVDFLTEENISIETLMKEIPPITMVKTFVEVSKEDMEKALDRIKNIKSEKEESPEGVKITFDKGWVVVVPDAYNDACAVVSEGINSEFARELCDFCVDEILR